MVKIMSLLLLRSTCWEVHSKNVWILNGCVCILFAIGRGSILGHWPKYKGNSICFPIGIYMWGLLGDMSPICHSQPGLGRDTNSWYLFIFSKICYPSKYKIIKNWGLVHLIDIPFIYHHDLSSFSRFSISGLFVCLD